MSRPQESRAAMGQPKTANGDRARELPQDSNDNNNNAGSNTEFWLQEQMQQVLDLMEARTQGKASNEQVELAVDQMLVLQRSSSTRESASSKASKSQQSSHPLIASTRSMNSAHRESSREAGDNYDDNDDDDENPIVPDAVVSLSQPCSDNIMPSEVPSCSAILANHPSLASASHQRHRMETGKSTFRGGHDSDHAIQVDFEVYDDDDDEDEEVGDDQRDYDADDSDVEFVKVMDLGTMEHSSASSRKDEANGEQLDSSSARLPDTEPTPVKRKRGRPRKNLPLVAATARMAAKNFLRQVDWSVYEDIPLGKQGAQMMTTFGDGKHPDPAAVRATLLGARRMLQVAVQDARYIRHKQKQVYQDARATLVDAPYLRRKQAQSQEQRELPPLRQFQGEWSSEILYRVTMGYDALGQEMKCGFAMEELQMLFPEEINSYTRWNDMHNECNASSQATEKQHLKPQELDLGNSLAAKAKMAQSMPDEMAGLHGGHLQDRLAQFDMRTDRMKQDWYMAFSEVIRQGSFLPRRKWKSTSQQDKMWEQQRRQTTTPQDGLTEGGAVGLRRGRKKDGAWHNMSANEVRFLHWVGFDPDSALPPPSADTTHALAFLAYDFFGRIVERAIILRSQQRKQTAHEIDGANPQGHNVENNSVGKADGEELLELAGDDQLLEKDIARAMEDPHIRSVPMFSGSSNHQWIPQLYFGPGFESRLEMELDEIMASLHHQHRESKHNGTSNTRKATSGTGSTNISEEDLRLREQEDVFFARLAAKAPDADGIASLLDPQNQEQPLEQEQEQPAACVPRKRELATTEGDHQSSNGINCDDSISNINRSIGGNAHAVSRSQSASPPPPETKRRRGRPPSKLPRNQS